MKKKFTDIITTSGNEYSLSASERARMTHTIREYMAHKPIPQAQSGSSAAMFSWLSFIHTPVALALVMMLVFGSSVSYAAESALPGDVLYPVKTLVNEPVRVALATDAEASARVHIDLAERRIEEATILAAEGNLDEETHDELTKSFESHASAANDNIAKTKDSEDSSASVELATTFENRLSAHEAVLAEIEIEIEDESGVTHTHKLADAIRTINATLAEAHTSRTQTMTLALDASTETMALNATTRSMKASAPMDTADIAQEAPTLAMTMSVATTESTETESIASTITDEMPAPEPVPAPDQKAVARMKYSAEKNLKTAQKTLQSTIRALTKDARNRAEDDIDSAAKLLRDGKELLEDEDTLQAYVAFEESARISDQAIVYIKAAPSIEKARARSAKKNSSSTNNPSEKTIEGSVEGAAISNPEKFNESKEARNSTDSSSEDSTPSTTENTVKPNTEDSNRHNEDEEDEDEPKKSREESSSGKGGVNLNINLSH